MINQSRPRSTDAYTKGGQIFGHIWRMRWQNIKILIIISLLGWVVGTALMIYVKRLTLWHLWDFYLLSYIGGSLKVLNWSWLQEFLLNADATLKGLMRGSRGIPQAHHSLFQLTTTLFIPEAGRILSMKTILFLRHPWVQQGVLQIHLCFLGGLVGAFLTTLVSLWYFRYKSEQIEKDRVLKGQEVVSPQNLAKLLKSQGKVSSFLITSELPFVKGTEVEHLMISGATRTGKTNFILSLLQQVRSHKQRAVILDLTGELTARFYRAGQDILLNPLDVRSKPWDIWTENLNPVEYDAWAAALVPEGGNDPIWHETARKLLSFTAQKLESSSSKSMKDILQWACWDPLGDETEKFYQNSPVSPIMRQASEKTAVGVRMNLSVAIDAFKYLKEDSKSFSITRWVQEEKEDSWLFLTALPSQRVALASLLASWCNFAFLGLERLGPSFDRRLWFIVDEFPGLCQKITALPRMLTEGAKYGACCVLGFQNKSQLDNLYNPYVTRTLLSNCNTKVIFRAPETDTAKYLSQLLGDQEVFEAAESISMGAHHIRDGVNVSGQQRHRAVVLERDIMSLEKREAYIMLPGNLPLTKVTFPITRIEPKAAPFIQG